METKKERKPPKELTPQEMQKKKKMLVYPLFGLIFIASMWLIFAPSSDTQQKQVSGFNSELPIPKDEAIVGDKRTAYQQEAMQNKQNEKMRSLQDFAFMLSEEENRKAQANEQQVNLTPDIQGVSTNNRSPQTGIQSSASAYRDVNRQLNDWYEQSAIKEDAKAQLEMQKRIEELEIQLAEKSETDKQLKLIEKSYEMAAKYMPNTQEQTAPIAGMREKVIPKPVSQVHQSVVSRLAAPMGDPEFVEQYSKPRNMGFVTPLETKIQETKNSIRACVYQTVTLSNGKELQLRLQESIRAGNILIPANTILTGSAKIGAERLHITITSIEYAGNIIPVEMEVYDLDGLQGIFVPNSDEVNAAKEIAANMGGQMGSSITISDDAGSQLAADLGRSAIQGVSQFFSKKMREVKVTLKSGYKVLLLPKA